MLVVVLSYGCSPATQDDYIAPPLPQAQATITPIDLIWKTATPSVDPDSLQIHTSTLPLESKYYIHPQDLFAIRPPEGWTIEEYDYSTVFSAQEDYSRIHVSLTNTGYQIDASAFERYVSAREISIFSDFEEYDIIHENIKPGKGTAEIQKSLIDDGIPQVVESFYLQRGSLIGSIDIWAPEELFSGYQLSYDRIQSGFIINSEVDSSDVPIYALSYNYPCPEDVCAFEVPEAWTLKDSEGDFTEVHTFSSPDIQAYIQLAIFDDGEEISETVAGNFALDLLRTYYASDVVVTDDTFLSDGRERLDWFSAEGNFSGSSTFETRGTTFIMFSVMSNDAYLDTFSEVREHIFDSYTIP
jgi:hypothetical protein